MNPPSFLLDENMPHRAIRKLLRRREPEIHVWVIGQPGAPALGSSDLELLVWIEQHDCLLVTRNRASMPGHLRDHSESNVLVRSDKTSRVSYESNQLPVSQSCHSGQGLAFQ